MPKFTNGNKPSWLAIITAIGIVLLIVINFDRIINIFVDKGAGTALMAQAVSTNTVKIDTVIERIEIREEKFDNYLTQQIVRNALDSVKTEAIMEFVKQQVEFNGEVKKHLIKSEDENP